MARYDGGGVDAALKDLSKVMERTRVRLDALDRSHMELKEAIRDGRRASQEATVAVGELRREVTEFRQDVTEVRQDVRELKHEVSALKQKVEVLDSKVDALDSKVDALDSKVHTLDNRVHTLEDKSKASDHRLLVVEEKVDVFSRDLQVVRAGFEQAVESLAKLSEHVGASTSELRRGLFHVNGKVARLTVDREDTERRLQAHESILNKLLKN
ncbi:hypothetical protein HUA76_07230 [Myxococcus sp. CA056]|uniref:hypothetical protein n=1 Tax=Myxococcus sp. CA056 TaxID=2741740 RepID=UPI00157A7AF8|nr:hypothetical protein [Myxococcus sp. CA056]NTX10574.1 hypothetical protein [Myxococcus sp. CA056]